MPRVPNTRSTSVYWLYDVRPTTLLDYPRGRPFYCGKTVYDLETRLAQHQSIARRNKKRLISTWLNDCGEHVRIRSMELVPVDCDWAERERYWIRTLRTLYPGGANVTEGGQGSPGNVHTDIAKAKMAAAARQRSPETLAKIGFASANRDPEVYAKIGASNRGRVASAETRVKLSIAGRGKKRSPETRAKMKAAALKRPRESWDHVRKPMSPEIKAKISAAHVGLKHSPQSVESMKAAARRRREKREAESIDAHAI